MSRYLIIFIVEMRHRVYAARLVELSGIHHEFPNRNAPGVGLGLALCRRRARERGGRLDGKKAPTGQARWSNDGCRLENDRAVAVAPGVLGNQGLDRPELLSLPRERVGAVGRVDKDWQAPALAMQCGRAGMSSLATIY
jgi:hypothetical protein